MRTPKAYAKRGASWRPEAIACRLHNRSAIAHRIPTLALRQRKNVPEYEFWQVLLPTPSPTGGQDGTPLGMSGATEHLLLEVPVSPGYLMVATQRCDRGGVGDKSAQNSSPGVLFRVGRMFQSY